MQGTLFDGSRTRKDLLRSYVSELFVPETDFHWNFQSRECDLSVKTASSQAFKVFQDKKRLSNSKALKEEAHYLTHNTLCTQLQRAMERKNKRKIQQPTKLLSLPLFLLSPKTCPSVIWHRFSHLSNSNMHTRVYTKLFFSFTSNKHLIFVHAINDDKASNGSGGKNRVDAGSFSEFPVCHRIRLRVSYRSAQTKGKQIALQLEPISSCCLELRLNGLF